MRTPPTASAAFTLIEMLAVISIAAILAGVAVPSVVSTLRADAVKRAASTVEEAAMVARRLAITAGSHDAVDVIDWSKRYGVVLVDGPGGAYVAVTHGAGATAANVLKGPAGSPAQDTPVFRKDLPRGIGFRTGTDCTALTRLSGEIGWMYQPHIGFVTPDGIASLDVQRIGSLDKGAAEQHIVVTGDASAAILIAVQPTGGVRSKRIDGVR